MKTDDLIELLVKDLAPWRFRSILAGAVAGGIIIAAILFFVGIGFRPDISQAVKINRFLFKFVVTVSLAVTAIWVTLSVGRPGGSLAHRGFALAIAPALLACAAVVELLVLPESPMDAPSGWPQRALLPDANPLAFDRPARLSTVRAARGRTVEPRSGRCRRRFGGKRHRRDLLCGKLHR